MTAQELLDIWSERGRRYTDRRTLSEREVVSVLAWRRKEVNALPASERRRAYNELQRWHR